MMPPIGILRDPTLAMSTGTAMGCEEDGMCEMKGHEDRDRVQGLQGCNSTGSRRNEAERHRES